MSVKKNGSLQVDDGNVAKVKTFAEAVKIGLQRNSHKFGFRTLTVKKIRLPSLESLLPVLEASWK
jgi:hypothetical protein